MIKVIGQPWCGESVRIVKLGHLGLVEVPHNPVHVILREEFPFPQNTNTNALFLPFPAMCSLGMACNWLNISEHLSMIRFLNIDLI